MNPPYALITGASSGIGLELAHVYAEHGYNLVLIAQDNERLSAVAKTLEREYGQKVHSLTLDLTSSNWFSQLTKFLENKKLEIDVAINNAGFGLYGPATETSFADEQNMIELNIITLTRLSKYFARQMKKRGSGSIINVASVAGFYPGIYMSVYYATKAYVLSYSLALAEELAKSGVHVMALCPGPTKTNFVARAKATRSRIFGKPMQARVVAEQCYRGMKHSKRLVVIGGRNKASVFLSRFLPHTISASSASGEWKVKRRE
ncbi:SDR family oxidoreductase [Candidatus Saccharibacteria bacterium]|nr:SDR family oxidoreductase [Candidatus Saccharibacteria bacterium]